MVRPALAVAAAAALNACAATPKPAAPVAASPTPACAAFSFPVYFETASDILRDAAMQVVRDAAQRVRGCSLGRIDVVGLADADGPAGANLALSRRRAASVAAALAAAGLPRPLFDIEALGENGALASGGGPEPLRRRTEVVIRAAPPAPASGKAPGNEDRGRRRATP